ncbi:YdeI/OmpD-associated family protein [Abyssalbus ytuae]|uniref:YdeI/OmpD-associated family protein n=1 Tax=Abyssalbus ytuae TaxID=2926907 RepID=A0A9E6ZZ37_9FLAO|nr:YdeI/OmpD-associated family protein [Abyssalbus ytuae]UOB17827.1 YdeI/OmpD-associated family protein [Abyssalbus ytuae]
MVDEENHYYFKTKEEWRKWLEKNHNSSNGIYLIFYKVESSYESMRWEEAVREALCFGWIDSTVKKLDNERRRQYFSPRNNKSTWSKLNKTYIKELIENGLMHEAGLAKIEMAKQNGSWTAYDDVENFIIPDDLKKAFNKNKKAFENYLNFSKTYKKSYLYWLHQAKRSETREKRIKEIIELCANNKKTKQ